MNDTFTNKLGNLSIKISKDKLSAWLTIKKTGRLIDEQEILDIIDAAGIKYGFEDALRHNRKHNLQRDFDQPFAIAMCKASAANQAIKHYFDLEAAKSFSVHTSCDQIKQLSCLEAGTVLADLYENIFERDGSIYNVLGEMIRFDDRTMQENQNLAGENVSFDPSKGRFISNKAGYVSMDSDGRIHIHDELFIQDDLIGVQDLRLPVSLQVKGRVEQSSIMVGGNLSIEGSIKGSHIYCGGELHVSGQIGSCRSPGVEALGSLECEAISGSRVLCKQVLRCAKIENSEVVGEAAVLLFSSANISNSTVQSSTLIQADSIGDERLTNFCQLEITISPYFKTLLMQLTKDLVHAKQQGALDEAQKISERINSIEKQLDAELNSFLTDEQREPAKVKISGSILPQLKVRVLKHSYEIQQAQIGLYIDEKQ